MDGRKGSASFFAPWSRHVEPFIRIATGDYRSLEAELGHDDALAAFITSLAHEVIHYQQWIETGRVYDAGGPSASGEDVAKLREVEAAALIPAKKALNS